MVVITLLVFVAIFVAIFYYLFIKPLKYWKKRGIPQTNPSWFIGDFTDLVLQRLSWPDYIKQIYDNFPEERYIGTYEMMAPTLIIRDPELIKQISITDFDYFSDHIPFIHKEVDLLWSKNIFTLTGQKWKNMRSILSPTFTSSKMKIMFELMNEYAEQFCQNLTKRKNNNEDIMKIEMKDVFACFTNDIFATTVFGLQIDSLTSPDNEFYAMGREATDITGWKSIRFVLDLIIPQLAKIKCLGIKMFNDRVNKFFTKIIEETIAWREQKLVYRRDLIQLLVEAKLQKQEQSLDESNEVEAGFAAVKDTIKYQTGNSVLNNEDIVAQAMLFYFGGFDTTSTLMTFAAYELAVNDEIQEKLKNEINDTFERCDEKLTYEVLMNMKYLDMVVSETLRKWPPMVQMDRFCTKTYTIEPVSPKEKRVLIEKDTRIRFPYFAIHRDSKFYPNPNKFDPDRFSDERKKQIKQGTYLPFGIGPRNCIGSRFALLETKVMIFHLLRNFKVIPIDETEIPVKISKKSFSLVTDNGMHLGLVRM